MENDNIDNKNENENLENITENTIDDNADIDIENNTDNSIANNEDVDNESNIENNDDKLDKDDNSLIEQKYQESEEKYKRLLAEFDNFRKRTEKEKMMMTDFGSTLVLSQILPVVDNFERAIDSISDDIKENSFVLGIKKIYEQLMKMLEDLDVKPIKATGEKFDQNLHNAVMTDEESDVEEGIITCELQKGYTYKDQVLRHSMVKVKK